MAILDALFPVYEPLYLVLALPSFSPLSSLVPPLRSLAPSLRLLARSLVNQDAEHS